MFNNNKYLFIFILLLGTLFLNNPLFANKSDKKSRVAVFPITTINIPQSYGESIRNDLEYQLTNSGQFDVLERQITQKILAEKKIKKQQLSHVAQILAADYMVTGSIEVVENYILRVKVISGESGKILFVYSQKYQDKNDYSRCAKFISEKIVKDLNNYSEDAILSNYRSPNYYLSFYFNYMQPINNFTEIVNYGIGGTFNFTLEYGVYNIIFCTAYYTYSVKAKNLKHLEIIPMNIGVGYKYRFWDRYYIMPFLNLGYSYIIKEKETFKSNEVYTDFEFNIQAGLVFALKIKSDIIFEVAPSYISYFEKEYDIDAVHFNIGLKYLL